MFKNQFLGASLISISVSLAYAQDSPSRVDSFIEHLAPSTSSDPGSTGVIPVQAATESEIVGRLAWSEPRSVGGSTAAVRLPVIITGHESEVVGAIRGLPSMQVAVAFQGDSDALAPESGALLGDLGKALNNPKLANSRFVIGVHTDSVGSEISIFLACAPKQ
jgi:outer membrane protein OmpA-like peptidoglycan-associated protein